MPNGQPQTDRELLLHINTNLKNHMRSSEEHFERGSKMMEDHESRLRKMEAKKLPCDNLEVRVAGIEKTNKDTPTTSKITIRVLGLILATVGIVGGLIGVIIELIKG